MMKSDPNISVGEKSHRGKHMARLQIIRSAGGARIYGEAICIKSPKQLFSFHVEKRERSYVGQ